MSPHSEKPEWATLAGDAFLLEADQWPSLGCIQSFWKNFRENIKDAAINQLDAKAGAVVTKHYGSREAQMDAAKKRREAGEVVASHLAREVSPK